MWKSKRRLRNRRSKWIFFLSLFFSFCIFVLFFYFYSYYQKSFLVSPLPITKPSLQSEIQDVLTKAGVAFSTIETASDSSYIVHLSSGEEVWLSSSKNIASQVASLQLVLSRLTIEGKGFARLDFRFEKPIIVFK